MKRKTLCLLLVLVLTMGLTATFSFADEIGNGDDGTYSTVAVTFANKRNSNTKASSTVDVVFSKTADDYVIAIVLQKKSSGKWVTATDLSGSATYFRGSNKQSILVDKLWTVKSGVLYRVKCVSTDTYDSGISYNQTTYSDPF